MNELASSPHLIGLTSTSKQVTVSQLLLAAASLSKQVTRDFSPIWGIQAVVSAFASPKDIPHGYWPITIMDQLDDPNAAGYHSDKNNQPYSVVLADQGWEITCSHELLEMIADPFGNRLIPGMINGEAVRVLMEPGDPCENFSYSINGIQVSDFLTWMYYVPETIVGRYYSFMNKLPGPRTVAPGGYLSFLKSDGNWYQMTWFSGTQPVINMLASDKDRPRWMSLREYVDGLTLKIKRDLVNLKTPNLLFRVR